MYFRVGRQAGTNTSRNQQTMLMNPRKPIHPAGIHTRARNGFSASKSHRLGGRTDWRSRAESSRLRLLGPSPRGYEFVGTDGTVLCCSFAFFSGCASMQARAGKDRPGQGGGGKPFGQKTRGCTDDACPRYGPVDSQATKQVREHTPTATQQSVKVPQAPLRCLGADEGEWESSGLRRGEGEVGGRGWGVSSQLSTMGMRMGMRMRMGWDGWVHGWMDG